MRTIFLFALILLLSMSLSFGQAGPKQKHPARPDTSRTQPANEMPVPAAQNVREAAPPAPESAIGRESPTAPSDHVKRALFTTAVVDREPAGSIDSLSTARDQVYFFSEITGLTGHDVAHRWMHNGEMFSEVHFMIGGPRWRVYSSKRLLPSWTGVWRVDIINDDGSILARRELRYFRAENSD